MGCPHMGLEPPQQCGTHDRPFASLCWGARKPALSHTTGKTLFVAWKGGQAQGPSAGISRGLGGRTECLGPSFVPGWSWDAAGGQLGCCIPSPGISSGWQPGCRDSVQSLILGFAKFIFCKIQFNPSIEWGRKRKPTQPVTAIAQLRHWTPHACEGWAPGRVNLSHGLGAAAWPLCGCLGAAGSLTPAPREGFEGPECPHQGEGASGSCAGPVGGRRRAEGLKCCGAAPQRSAADLVLLATLGRAPLTGHIRGAASTLCPRGGWAERSDLRLLWASTTQAG